MKVLVLGETGMLGSRLIEVFEQAGIDVSSTTRGAPSRSSSLQFDAAHDDVDALLQECRNVDYIVNAIGIIKPYIDDARSADVERAIRVNALFPHRLANAANARNTRVIQIATDCVFSGSAGHYSELSPHDPIDVYGKTKSLGEVSSSNVMNIRSSIIGREVGRSTSLTEWVAGHSQGAQLPGFVNHQWNGVTTEAFARICLGVMQHDVFLPSTIHLVPSSEVSKYTLVTEIARALGRSDLIIEPVEAATSIDRTLSTRTPEVNESIWHAAGYPEIPSVEELVATTL